MGTNPRKGFLNYTGQEEARWEQAGGVAAFSSLGS